jgi:hypothetical protein
MNKAIAFTLRIPIVVLAGAVIFGVLVKPSVINVVMCFATLAFCSAIWSGTELLNGPTEQMNERFIAASKKMKISVLIAAVGMLVGQLLQQWWPHA